MTDEQIVQLPIEKIPEESGEFTPMAEAKIQAALSEIKARSFSGRNPHFGKMINCKVCGLRHRDSDVTYREKRDETGKKIGVEIVPVRSKCEQKFTSTVKDSDGRLYEQFRETEDGLVPDLRTAVREGERPTVRQQVGAASFNKKRYHPHPSKIKLLFIERTRKVFEALGFSLEPAKGQETAEFQTEFSKNLQRARVVAARQIRKERRLSSREVRRRQDQSRRINQGLL